MEFAQVLYFYSTILRYLSFTWLFTFSAMLYSHSTFIVPLLHKIYLKTLQIEFCIRVTVAHFKIMYLINSQI